MIDGNAIHASEPIDESQLQPASLDLRLGPVAYKVAASFLPTGSARVLNRLRDVLIGEIDLTSKQVLERGSLYLIPLLEDLNLPANVLGKSNPKSTTRRLDV